jgi:tetratricopeptide repeat protein
MNAELYLKKAVLQLAKGLEGKSIESLNKVLETGGDDQISLIKAHLIFAEYYIMKGDVPQAEEHLSYINNIYEESDEEFDDLLNDEFFEADMLLDIIERFRFLRK